MPIRCFAEFEEEVAAVRAGAQSELIMARATPAAVTFFNIRNLRWFVS